MSTGPKTAEGIERIRRAKWKHGRYSKKADAGELSCQGTSPPGNLPKMLERK
jgi:hypothetical protein